METTTQNGVRTETVTGPVTLSRLYKSDFQKEGSITAEVRQLITTKSFYPSKKVDSNMQQGLAATAEFGYKEQEFTSEEHRVAFINVPEKWDSVITEGKIAEGNKNKSCIYKVLANEPILDDKQKHAVEAGLRTKDEFADSQAVRFPDGAKDNSGNDIGGKLILDKNGNVQYRRTFYWGSPKADIDARSTENVYLSQNLAVELKGASVLAGQSL